MKKHNNNKRTVATSFMLTDQENNELSHFAELCEQSQSAYIRKAIQQRNNSIKNKLIIL